MDNPWFNAVKMANDSYNSANSISNGKDGMSSLGGIMQLVSSIASLF